LKQLKIDIVILSDPDFYPPTINAANILAERGHDINLIGIHYEKAQRQKLHPSIKRINYGSHKTGLQNVWQYFSFFWRLKKQIKSRKPDWVIAYDSMAVGPTAFAAGKKTKWIFHNHDLFTNPRGWYKLISWLEKRWSHKATLVSFPQEDRARFFMKQASLNTFPSIVYNGPRKEWAGLMQPPHTALQAWIRDDKFIVLYQGQFSKYFNLDILIRSFQFLPERVVLCIVGRPLEAGIVEEYESIISEIKLKHRVQILKSVTYDQVPSITRHCNLGIAKLGMDKNIPFNDYYLTGASNKVSEYLAVGLPVLMADTEVNREFYSTYGFAIFADGTSAKKIAEAIEPLTAPGSTVYAQLRQQATKAGKEIFNFDTQFEKIISVIENR